MKLTIQSQHVDDLFEIEIEDDGTIDDIKTMIVVAKDYPMERQILYHDGKVLSNDMAKAKSVGLKDYEIVTVVLQDSAPSRIGAPRVAGAQQQR